MPVPIEGGCLCGSVRYSIRSEPHMAVICHCRDCQRSSGAPLAASMMFPERDVTVTGEVRRFAGTADSGNAVDRGFCPKCGSQILAQTSGFPGNIVIAAGSLDDTSLFNAGLTVYCRSAMNGVSIPDDIPSFDAMPTP